MVPLSRVSTGSAYGALPSQEVPHLIISSSLHIFHIQPEISDVKSPDPPNSFVESYIKQEHQTTETLLSETLHQLTKRIKMKINHAHNRFLTLDERIKIIHTHSHFSHYLRKLK